MHDTTRSSSSSSTALDESSGFAHEQAGYRTLASIEDGKVHNAPPSASDAACRSLAFYVTVFLWCIYAAPTVLAIQLGLDPDAAFWIGHFGLAAAIVPMLNFVAYLVHLWLLRTGRRKKDFVIFSAVIPGTLLILTGGSYKTMAWYLYGHLRSEECSNTAVVPAKARLQAAYMDARSIYSACVRRLFIANGNVTLPRRPTLQACQEWAQLGDGYDEDNVEPWRRYTIATTRQWSKEFQYLASMEANHVCSGFCVAGPSLWTDYDLTGRQGSRCAPYIALKLLVVQREGEVVLWTSIIGLVTFLITVLLTKPRWRVMGYH